MIDATFGRGPTGIGSMRKFSHVCILLTNRERKVVQRAVYLFNQDVSRKRRMYYDSFKKKQSCMP